MPSWLERFRSWRKQRRNYYMLDSRKLQPGDIFFSTERAAESFFIRLFTLSGYSHASIYLGDSLYAEAVGLGVRVRSTTTFVKETIKVTRLKGGAPSQAVALAAANRVDHYLHVPYALPSAILSIFGRLPSKDERALFCSQLVAQAYADIGIAVVPKLDAVKVTPALLAKSEIFEDITKSAAFRTRAVSQHLVGAEFETLSDREVACVEKMYQMLRPIFEKRGIVVPKSWVRMLRFLADVNHKGLQEELDLAVMKAMQDSGYIGLLGAVLDESLKPFEIWLQEFDPSKLPKPHQALYQYSFANNLTALERQAEIDRDNLNFWREEQQKNGLHSFTALAKYAETHLMQRNAMIELTRTALAKLDGC